MDISLPQDLVERVRQKAASGRAPADIVRDALDALDEKEWLEHERREVRRGLAQAERGEAAPFDLEDTLRRAHQRHARSHRPSA
jgi:Arc/MetJ-type ribon-helix-helix transcriptional regulator